jgi:hypothetical protein
MARRQETAGPKAGSRQDRSGPAASSANAPSPLLIAQPPRDFRAPALERHEAEWAFVREGRSLQEVAQAHGREFSTIQRWAKDGLWKEARRTYLLSSQGQADILQEEVSKVLMELKRGEKQLSAPIAHMILVANRAAQEMRGDKYSWTQMFALLKDLTRHIRAAQPDALPLFEPLLESFITAKKGEMLPAKKG